MVSHATGGIPGWSAAKVAEHYKKDVAPGTTLRGRDEILRFFAGLELVEQGLIQVPYWRPDEPEPADAEKVWFLGAVGRRPSTAEA